MPTWNRRSVLATGAALSLGGLASIGSGSEGDDVTELPDPTIDPNPGLDEDWPSFAGDAGHARFIEDGHEFDGDLEVAWTVADDEFTSNGFFPSVAVADGSVYVTGPTTHTLEEASFGVAAYDAADGSLRWRNDDVTAGDPSVVDDTVYVTGEELFALDAADGSVRWQTEFDPEAPIETQTVAYGAVFVVVDSTLYALEADDGSLRWEIDSVSVTTDDGSEEEFGFRSTTAAANGVIYARVGRESGARLAIEPESGEVLWKNEQKDEHHSPHRSGQIRASATAVTFDGPTYAWSLADAQTGDELRRVSEFGLAFDDEIIVGYGDYSYNAGSIDPDDDTGWNVNIHFGTITSVISGDTVYAYFPGHDLSDSPDYHKELVALDKYDGTEKWVVGNRNSRSARFGRSAARRSTSSTTTNSSRSGSNRTRKTVTTSPMRMTERTRVTTDPAMTAPMMTAPMVTPVATRTRETTSRADPTTRTTNGTGTTATREKMIATTTVPARTTIRPTTGANPAATRAGPPVETTIRPTKATLKPRPTPKTEPRRIPGTKPRPTPETTPTPTTCPASRPVPDSSAGRPPSSGCAGRRALTNRPA